MTKEEAIHNVKYGLLGLYIDDKTKAALEMLIPELQENDDDKVRKEIIEYLKCVGKGDGDYAQPMINRWISYLEKQKPTEEVIPVNGQKYYACHEFDREFENQVSHLIASVLNGEYPYTRGFVKWVAQSLFGYAKAELEQAGSKRNPEEDQLIGFIYDLLEILYWRKDWAMSKEECLRRLNNYIPRNQATINGEPIPVQNQSVDIPLAEWGEEGELYLSQAIETLEHENYFVLAENLKSLRPQQKVEWSEEDDERLESIDNMLWKLDSYIGDDCTIPQEKSDSMRAEIHNVLCPWLKLLRKKLKMK